EGVATGHRVVRVEQIPYLARDPRQLVQRDPTVRSIEQQAQDQPATLRAVLHVDQLEFRRECERLGQFPDALGDRGPIHESCSSKIKKWAGPTFVWSVKAGRIPCITRGPKPRNGAWARPVRRRLSRRASTTGTSPRSAARIVRPSPCASPSGSP